MKSKYKILFQLISSGLDNDSSDQQTAIETLKLIQQYHNTQIKRCKELEQKYEELFRITETYIKLVHKLQAHSN